MIGMQYQSYQYYSYENLKELQEIIKVDGIGIMDIDEDEQIIEYQIDRSKCVRLSDLIYMIVISIIIHYQTQNFLRFHLGQLLDLFQKLLKKVMLFQINHIEHSYLDTNRIWLVFENQSPPLSIVYTTIDYKIAFTGYQCQFYEKGSNIISADYQIQKIIKVILNNFKKNNIFFNDSKKNEIKQQIYDPIIQACDKHDIKNTQSVINYIQADFEFQKEQQTISWDIQLENSKVDLVRKQHIDQIQQQLKDYIQALKQETSFTLEFIILTQIQNMAAPLDNPKCKFNKVDKNNEYFKFVKQIQEENQIIQKNHLQKDIQQAVDKALKKMLEYYKFEFSQEEKQELYDGVLERILNLKLMQYFYNSPHYHFEISQENLLERELSLQRQFIQKIANEEVGRLIQLHILILINDLI